MPLIAIISSVKAQPLKQLDIPTNRSNFICEPTIAANQFNGRHAITLIAELYFINKINSNFRAR
jgi:hypothetical protein